MTDAVNDPLDVLFASPEEIQRMIAAGELVVPTIEPSRTPVEEAIIAQCDKILRRRRTVLDHIASLNEELKGIDGQLEELKSGLETLRKAARHDAT